ncbi:MAG: NAD(P)/FAD-dependent oxidoreductase [Alphaproteobacteria bacterium]|nr:NAD(P)/FAD-dependent oxidoreductase [Alphaproteobacteria bacterium]
MGFDAEVIVVGGGLAGLATAVGLWSRGREVLVLDRASAGRDKPCGEGMLPHGVAALVRAGFPIPEPSMRFVGIAYRDGDTRAMGTFPRGGTGLGVRRTVLDASLDAHARSLGVPVRRGVRVTGLGGEAGAWRVSTSDGELRARVVVGADGARSPTRRLLGLHADPAGRKRWALRRHHALRPGVPDPERVVVSLVEDAELYVTPTAPGQVNVAVLTEDVLTPTFRGDRDGAHARLVTRDPALAEMLAEPVSETLATGPLRVAARDVVTDGAVLVGDAAGFVDGITGEGMSLTLVAAELAAEVVAAALVRGTLDARSLRPYARRRRAAVAASNRMTEMVLAGIRHRRLASRVVRHLARSPATFDRLLALDAGEGSPLDLLWLARAAL